MLFNSFSFLVFFLVFFVLYWFVFTKLKTQNLLVLVGGCIFYGWWDWRFLFLLAFSTVLGYVAAQAISTTESEKKRKVILWATVVINLCLLFFFKYFNFFIQSAIDAFAFFNLSSNLSLLKIILPIGISFYTFQKLSYVIDVYHRKMEPAKRFIDFAAYVSFFPQLLAGPIERANTLLPQFYVTRTFNKDRAIAGLHQIVYGLFKKIVVADNCAFFVNTIWGDYNNLSGPTLILGAILFAFQIYCDFSGYTDIALGCAKLLGLELMTNFKFPYFARSIGEFWKRWHISLSSWFRDYVYIPLGGSRHGKLITLRNVGIVFLLSGIWHGANWTFVVWGALHALLFIPSIFFRTKNVTEVVAQHTVFPNVKEVMQLVVTFSLVCVAWVFFRSDSLSQALEFLTRFTIAGNPLTFFGKTNTSLLLSGVVVLGIGQLVVTDWMNRKKEFVTFRYGIMMCVCYIIEICFLGSFKNQFEFIYFQF